MAGVRIHISLFGDELMSRGIVRVSDRAGDMDPAFRSIFDRLMEINAEQFRSQGSRGGTPWAELADSTKERKSRLGLDPDILFETHALFEALTSPSSPDSETQYNQTWAVFRVTGDPAEYGMFHQKGTVNMPKRPPFQLTETDKRAFVKEMERFLFTGKTGSFTI